MEHEIYPMPAFATFAVADLEASTRWYVDGLGFDVIARLEIPEGSPMLVHVRRAKYQDLLLVPRRGPAPEAAGAGVRVSFSAQADALGELAARAGVVGGGVVEGPAPTAWGTIDLVARDPDGYVVVMTARGTPDPLMTEALERARQAG